MFFSRIEVSGLRQNKKGKKKKEKEGRAKFKIRYH